MGKSEESAHVCASVNIQHQVHVSIDSRFGTGNVTFYDTDEAIAFGQAIIDAARGQVDEWCDECGYSPAAHVEDVLDHKFRASKKG